MSPERGEECVLLLQAAVSSLTERAEPKGHVVLILDKVGVPVLLIYVIEWRAPVKVVPLR